MLRLENNQRTAKGDTTEMDVKGRLTLTAPQLIAAIRELEGVTLSPRTLTTWAEQNIAVPSHWPRRKGRANVRHYQLAELRRIRLIVQLRRKQGISMHRVRAILGFLDAHYPDVWTRRTNRQLLLDGWRVLVRSPGSSDVEAPTGQAQLSFDLSEISDGTREAAQAAQRIA